MGEINDTPVDSIASIAPVTPSQTDTLVAPPGYVKEDTVVDVIPQDEASPAAPLTKEELKAQKKAQAENKREETQKRLEEKWAAKDAKDEVKAQKKAEKKAAKLRKKKLAAIKAAQRNEAKEQALLEKYKAKFQKEKDRLSEKAASSGKTKSFGKKDKTGLERVEVKDVENQL